MIACSGNMIAVLIDLYIGFMAGFIVATALDIAEARRERRR